MNSQVASSDPVESGEKYSNAAGVRPMSATQVGHLSATVTIVLFPSSIKDIRLQRHRPTATEATWEFV